ncbi:hypothetical protein ASG01_08835 [Chryseobacterium sp. Leaf180]|uniref:hypothetical protein n=1 Tax=Chryseobacterium sp. Leaf180 TaxID=1736289 RepID=UPI0006FDDD2F|nr:hypothetical protein [Chryseobacterium sp. Leaf180]KQR93292.1 hypothetical protein ASG01_08835 [Chryseobacterium sp. Leaf180]
MIKHILYEKGVKEIFRLIVPFGAYAGTYDIEKPNGWDEVDSIVNVDGEHFFVKNFIIGDTEKLKFTQYRHVKAYQLIKDVYNEQQIDGLVHFKCIGVKDGVEYDILKDDFDLNFSKYVHEFGKSMFKIEIEIIKSEAQNKFFTREETTVNLFETKDIDENEIDPVQTFDIGYKKGDKVLTNFYTFDISQPQYGAIAFDYKNKFFSFLKAEDSEIGDNTNKFASWINYSSFARKWQGDFLFTNISLPMMKVKISNLSMGVAKSGHTFPAASLYAIFRVGETAVRTVKIASTVSYPVSGGTDGIITIEYGEYELGNMNAGESLTFDISSDENVPIAAVPVNTNTSIEITTNLESPLVKSKGVRLINALDQITKNYTASGLSVVSNVIGEGGTYYNTSISTGMYLRGLPAVYLNQKIKTSFKKIFADGAAKLLTLGFDIVDNSVVVEDLKYWFKDLLVYDLSQKLYLTDEYQQQSDKEVIFNSLLFGSKKYSTNVREDIKNFTTSAEFTTPIKTVKNKLDKETDLIIDEFKIQELIEDKTTATGDNDDDLVLIDMVNVTDLYDQGVFENCVHSIDAGKLLLSCNITPFDTTMIEVGTVVEITQGKNIGQWTVLSIIDSKMKLDKSSGIEEGIIDTPLRYKISSLIKNRTNDGFTDPFAIRNFETSTNIRHNPKYHMARWFPWFGSGLRKKGNQEKIKVTNYKNNSTAQMRINSADLSNELPDLVTVGADEPLSRLRSYEATLFNGDQITISYAQISFGEFIAIYEAWRYGIDGNRMNSRGFLRLNTPEGIFDVYPFGDGAFTHSKRRNVLTIKGKVKGKSVDSPTLVSVVQIDKTKVNFVWDFNEEYINPISKLQYSLDGGSWQTLQEIADLKTLEIESDIFGEIMTGETIYFRVIVTTADFYNKISNTKNVLWQFNDYVIKEFLRTENIECGFSYLHIDFKGTGNFDLQFNFISQPGGGAAKVKDVSANITYAEFLPDYTFEHIETQTGSLAIANETKQITIQLNNSNKTDLGKILNCTSGNAEYYVYASLKLIVTETVSQEQKSFLLTAETMKRYLNRPPNPTQPVENSGV